MSRSLRGEHGQMLVLSAVVMALLFLPLSIFVIDDALVASGYAQLGDTLQASAEDGASSLDEAAYRSSGGKTVELDASAAREVAGRSLRVSGLPGLVAWSVDVNPQRVTVSGTLRVPLLVIGTATLKEMRSATLAYGQ